MKTIRFNYKNKEVNLSKLFLIGTIIVLSSTSIATELTSRCERIAWYDSYGCDVFDPSLWNCTSNNEVNEYQSGFSKGIADDIRDSIGNGQGCDYTINKNGTYVAKRSKK